MTTETKKSYCRLCTASCAIDVDVEDRRVVAVRGTKTDPVSGGYTCMKGRDQPFTHQMTSSRLRNVANSVGQTQANLRQDANRARLHPADLAALGIEAIASGSEDIRAGVVSIAHCWGQGDAGDVATRGVNTNRLLRCDLEFDAITGQPTTWAVPVMISPG
jgi:anaerobic selenocysteine-containing dehydrogenase